jgi:hypothetical protein
MAQPWAVEVLSVGAASVGAVTWRLSGRLHVSAIVKATFSFAPGATMTPTLPIPVRAAEVPHPEGSIREPRDTAPELTLADVIFVGHACTPALVPAPRLSVRVAVRTRSGALLLDKSLEVLGDRVFFPGKPPPEPAPFTRIPMIYERAYGGPDHRANPVGVGQFAELAGRRRLPNIVHPDKPPRPTVEPAGFAPISILWPQRRRLLGANPSHVLERPIAEISGELDKSYFQSAPVDQRTPILEGDEWIVLEGLNPAGAIETRLPSARGVARVYLPNGSSQSVKLVADTLLIDGDAEQCSITWRGSFPIPSVADLPATAIAAGVELPGRPVPLPDRFSTGGLGFASISTGRKAPPPLPGHFPSGGFGPPSSGRKATVALAPTLDPVLPAVPLPAAPLPAVAVPAPAAVVPAPQPRANLESTMMIDPTFEEPPKKVPPAPLPAPPPPQPRASMEGTMMLEPMFEEPPKKKPVPFKAPPKKA